VKQKWKTVRDNYRRSLNAVKTKSGQAAKTVTPYKFAGVLEFLKPFLDDREYVHVVDIKRPPTTNYIYILNVSAFVFAKH